MTTTARNLTTELAWRIVEASERLHELARRLSPDVPPRSAITVNQLDELSRRLDVSLGWMATRLAGVDTTETLCGVIDCPDPAHAPVGLS